MAQTSVLDIYATTAIAWRGGPMSERYKCGLCEISPSQETYYGTRDDVVDHIKAHNSQDIDLWLSSATTQATL